MNDEQLEGFKNIFKNFSGDLIMRDIA